METKTYDSIIIGAGLTGLTAGFYLKKETGDFLILESQSRSGGQIRTYQKDGYIYESGPNTGVIGNAEVAELFEDLDMPNLLEIADPSAKRRLIWKGDHFRELPSGLVSGVTTPLFTFFDKFRLLTEPFRAKGTDPDESLAGLVERRMGRSFLDYAVDPFLSGVYAGNPEYLVTKYALPKLYNLEQDYGSFIKGAIAKSKLPKTERDRKVTKDVFSTKGGLGALVDTLTKRVGDEHLLLGVAIDQIQPLSEGGFEISFKKDGVKSKLNARRILTTVPAYEIANLLSFVDNSLLEPISSLVYAPVVQISVGFDKLQKHPKPAFGGLVPSKENKKILGILYPYACFEQRAPEGGALFSFFIGGMRGKDLVDYSDEQLRALVKQEVKDMLKLGASDEPSLIEIFRHPRAIPQYGADSGQRLDSISKIEILYPGLVLGGNMQGGIGMADRIKQGRVLAERLSNNK